LEGHRVHPEDIIVHKQSKLWFHPGLNVSCFSKMIIIEGRMMMYLFPHNLILNSKVRLAGRLNMVARKSGTVRFTCETPNLSWENRIVQKYYQSRIMPNFKKYIHVIPDPQHTRFRFVESV
jgi:hypothetical protein